jgi:hypothetical protein
VVAMSVFTSTGTENRMRWDRRKRGFMEVWFATLNHGPTGSGLWVRYTLTSPAHAEPYCELWAFWFDPAGERSFAGKERYSIDHLGSANGRDDGALVRIGDAWMSESHLEGEVTAATRTLAWSLDLEPAARTFQHIPAALRDRLERRVSALCSPNLSVPFRGNVKLDGEGFEFDGDRGCQTHRWGARHAGTWAWAHCESFDGAPGTLFEGLAARTDIARIPLPTTSLLYLRHEGEDIPFNELRWALSAKSRYEMPMWAFHARNESWKIIGGARTTHDRTVQVRYEDPNGSERFCANSEIADLAIELYRDSPSGWRHVRSLISIRAAHLEFGRRTPFEGLAVTL